MQTISRMSARRHSRRRKWSFRCFAVLVGLLPILAAEGILRWLDSPAPLVADAVDHDPLVDLHQLRPLFVLSEDRQRWEIPPERYNFFRPASFHRDKPEGTFRIFAVGASTVQGRPYATETAFPAFLQLHLQQSRPDLRFEVVNCGGVSYASYRVAAIVGEVLGYEPDLVIIYTGHNEFLEDRTYAGWRSIPKPLAPVVALGSRSHLVQKLANIIRKSDERTLMESEVATRLDQIDGLDAFRRDDDWRAGVHDHFQNTIQRIVGRCRTTGVPLWLCVPASDVVKTPPFKVAADPSLSISEQQQMNSAWRQVLASDHEPPQGRVAICRSILQVDPQHAGAAYVVGLDAWQHNELESARKWLRIARDWDVCPLRATTTIEQTVRRIADKNAVPLLDVPELFDRPSGNHSTITVEGIADPSWFVDHVHPSIAGHQRIAEALFDLVHTEKMLPSDPAPTTSDERDAASLSARREAISNYMETLDEVYYHRGKQRLEGLRRWAAGRAGKPLYPPAP